MWHFLTKTTYFMANTSNKPEKIQSAIQFTDMPYVEGKKIKDTLYSASLTTMGGYLRFQIMRMPSVVSLNCYNETLILTARGKIDTKIFIDKIIELSEKVGVIINKIGYQKITGFCPVCKKMFTNNTAECLGKEGKDHHVISPIKEEKQPVLFSVTDFHLV